MGTVDCPEPKRRRAPDDARLPLGGHGAEPPRLGRHAAASGAQDLRFAVFSGVTANQPTENRMPWDEFAAVLADHKVGAKEGTCFSCGTFNGLRSGDNLATRALVALDIEAHRKTGEVPPAPNEVAYRLKEHGLAAVIYTTHSHRDADARYRIVLPMEAEFRFPADRAGHGKARHLDRRTVEAFALSLGLVGVLDTSKSGVESLFFLPRHEEGAPHYTQIIQGYPLDLQAIYDIVRADEERFEAAHQEMRRRPLIGIDGPIAAYNASHALNDVLVGAGYMRKPGSAVDWRSPLQGTDSYATRVYGDRWVSLSGSDAAAGIGMASKTGNARCGDAFDIYCYFHHGNDRAAALASLKQGASHSGHRGGTPPPPPGAGAGGAAASDAVGAGAEPTEEALAQDFAHRHRDDLRYVAAWDKWLHWNGARWRQDETRLAFDHARALCAEAADAHKTRARKIASAGTISAVERIAKARRWIAATVEQWDTDPWLLNTPGGTWDFHRGEQRPHEPADHITKVTAASADGSSCPTWLTFLARVTGGDPELQAYLQRMVGYALTGSTQEHAMFFLYGVGANGKSVFIEAVAGILGDYHTTAPIEVFMASQTDRHPTELAMLRGARLVTAVETEEGRQWAESKIKTLTGGDRIAARFMRQDFFEFTPQFKLVIAGNHRPRLRSVDEAIRRRFNLVPFVVTIPPAERDPRLGEKLKAEWPGILTWAIAGHMDWRQQGLNPPAAVRNATAAYFEAQDAMSVWLDECCTNDAADASNRSVLFKSWDEWAKRNGEIPGSARAFYEALEKRGFRPAKRSGDRCFLGLKVARGQVGAG